MDTHAALLRMQSKSRSSLRLRIGWLVIAGSLASGCAFTPIPLTLPEHGLDATIPGGNGRSVAVVVPFADERKTRERCGMQKNGYGMDTAPALCQSDPAQWIASLLAAELRASSFTVLDASAPHEPGTVVIEGALEKLFVEPVIGWWSGSLETDLEVKLVATSASGLRAERTFFVKGIKSGVLASTMQPFHTSLDRATQEMVSEMVTAILALLDRYPQLGSAALPGWSLLGAVRS